MDRVLNTTGGRPFKNEDLQLFEQLISMLESHYSEFQDGLVVSGMAITGTTGNYTIAAGYVYYSGYLCRFYGATGVSLPYAMEISDTEIDSRVHFDNVAKNTIRSVNIVGQVGGGFSFSNTSPRLSNYMPEKANQTEGRSGTDDNKYMTSLRVLDFIRNGTGVTASTSYKGTVQKSTSAQLVAATADVYPDAKLVWETLGYIPWQTASLNSGFTHGIQSLQYRFFNGVLLQIRGTINATVTAGTLFTLPSSYWPISLTTGFYSPGNSSAASFGITDTGDVITSGMSTSALNLFNSTIILD